MTWVVGTPSLFGNALLVSDIQVTFTTQGGRKVHLDCLQKIYPVGTSILGGFAGSVHIGLSLLNQLQYVSSKLGANQDWILDVIANTWWPRVARRIFKESHPDERKVGSQIILAAAHPKKNRGPWPWTDTYTFSSPNFEPRKAEAKEVLSIGSGSQIPYCVDAIKDMGEDFAFQQMAIGGKGGQGMLLSFVLSRTMRDNPQAGISQFFQCGIASRGDVSIQNFVMTEVSPSGEEKESEFPAVARNYEEFKRITRENGLTAEASVC